MDLPQLINQNINGIVVKCEENCEFSDGMDFLNSEMASLGLCNMDDEKAIQRSTAEEIEPKEIEKQFNLSDVNNASTASKENVQPSGDKHTPAMQSRSCSSPITPTKISSNTKADGKPMEKQIANLVSQWSVRKPLMTNNMGAVPKKSPIPHAYKFKDIYKRNRDEAVRSRHEQEQKLREFHSRPAPNFSALHQIERKGPIPITFPETPMVLKRSLPSLEERRKKKLDEVQRLELRQKTESNSLKTLKPGVEQLPFKLNVEKRLNERRRFDVKIQKTIELKQKQEEEERRRKEEEEIKLIRKNTMFKARPNPFK